MFTHKLIAVTLGLALVGGSVADASAKVATKTASKTVATHTMGGRSLRTSAARHRIHVSHRAVTKRVKIAKHVGGKRLVVSHLNKRITPKHV